MNRQIKYETSPMSVLPQSSNAGSIDTATLELLAAWQAHDATNDPEELRAAERELADFKRTMNENRVRAGELLLYP